MAIMGIFFINIFAQSVVCNLQYDESILKFEKAGDVIKIRIEGLEITNVPGAPELPVQNIKIAIPYGAKIKNIGLKIISSKELPGEYNLSWAQPPVILSRKEPFSPIERDEAIYLGKKKYPPDVIQFKGSGIYDNQQICEIVVFPIQYQPKAKKLILNTHIQITVNYEGGTKLMAKRGRMRNFVTNPEDIPGPELNRQGGDFNYLIITAPPMDTVFQKLADWKTKKGVRSKVRTTNWIISHYPGEDDAAKIRNYLKTLPDSGVMYVLLGGDVDFIPCRFAYAMDCSAGYYPGREDTMPCDLYYADLQGNWNFDGDHSYGEIEDSIDLYPDLFVGRAPVNTIAEAQKFVEKVLTYEKNPPLDYLNNALFAAEILWENPYTDQGVHKNRIGDESFPSDFELTKLYESLGNETPQTVKAAIRAGQNLINHDGHGWIDAMGVGTGYLNSQDFDTLTNEPKYGILYSIGCWTNAFDFSSISEAFVNSPQGGGVAFIGNTSYGWGSPGNPGFGYSDRFDSRFFYSLFIEENFHLGEALAMAKAYFIPYSREKNVYRWHQYQLNLLGDPELPIWTHNPETLLVSYPQSIPVGNAKILITVKAKQTASPIRDALVCLMKGNESYSAGYTDASGSIFLDATPLTTGDFALTVTAHNYLPVEKTIPVESGPYVNYQGWSINDPFGNNDHIPNPGEILFLSPIIKNCGNAGASSIQLVLRSPDNNVTIGDSIASINFLAPGDSIIIENAFAVEIGSVGNGYCIEFNLEISDNTHTISFMPDLIVGTPMMKIDGVRIFTLPNLPGKVESLFVNLKNYGFGIGHTTRTLLNSSDPYLFVLIDSVQYGDIAPESIKIPNDPFVIYISPFCPSSYLGKLLLNIYSENYQFTDTIEILVGETGFSDDMESGSGLWTTGGFNNLWHISTRRFFSPSHSWYCGDETSGQYVNNMNCDIQTVPFMVAENSLLRFRRWFSVPLYGTDGIYVIVLHNGLADTLDFIGTGGALGKRGIQSEWFEEVYALDDYPAGETIQIRIAFISDVDNAVGEGFYIDDVNVEYIYSVEETPNPNSAFRIPNLEVYPNPFQNHLLIKFQIPKQKVASSQKSVASIKIYDISGRLVRQWDSETIRLSDHIIWSGDDNAGRKLPAGIYFIYFSCGELNKLKKVVMLE
uniref:T9SS type A sorting domain-containing protein n=1 Tax=candidate division WOR-3 bacterium TaxID=2052148 RepID=A0A7C4XMH7_UNCW3